ncbi:iron ABC transporter permease [Corynebacterium sp. 13CS0277]|uniref:FecCD family ABC transporter permease n=1 Tax=Corynebacterium sp. 13CS0277 TaxID=2071994 RepID=UPI0011B1D656|nr:iron ABC transporter permease [Corynebacterium sp. 13CS0277]
MKFSPHSVPIPLVLIVMVIVLGISCIASLTVGSRANSLADGLQSILPGLRDDEGAGELAVIIRTLRIPRTIVAVLAGIALGAAGALMQGYTRNALADPGILGINAGGAFGVVAVVFFGVAETPAEYVWAALAGCLCATLVVFAVSSTGKMAANPLSVILAGVALSALLMAVVHGLVLADFNTLDTFRAWATGSVADRGWPVIRAVAPLATVGLLLSLVHGRALNALSLGGDVATSLGVPVARYRGLGMITIACLGGAATAAAGPIHFIGLAAPHMVRGILGVDYRLLVPAAALVGGILALWADMLGRLIARPGELEMGLVLALFGVPFFIALVRRNKVVAL